MVQETLSRLFESRSRLPTSNGTLRYFIDTTVRDWWDVFNEILFCTCYLEYGDVLRIQFLSLPPCLHL